MDWNSVNPDTWNFTNSEGDKEGNEVRKRPELSPLIYSDKRARTRPVMRRSQQQDTNDIVEPVQEFRSVRKLNLTD